MLPLAELPKLHGLPEAATAILETLDTFAVVLDRSLTPIYANPAARRSATIPGVNLHTEEFQRRASRVLETGTPSSRDPHTDDPTDTVRTHIVRIESQFLVVLAEDLGEEQRLNAMRRDFIANVSHELKTPIAAIGLLSEAVREAADDPLLVSDFAKSLIKESRRLASLSRDIIQLSEAQSTLSPEDLETVDLRELIEEEVDAHVTFAERQGVRLKLIDKSSPDRDAYIQGRAGSLATAVANVVSNAIRHSPEGDRVRVKMSHKKEYFAVSVTDHGEGISAEHIERIFERFYRVDGARSRDDGGTGLGLSIARHSMRAHGGDVVVKSEPGVGSKFTLLFPLYEPPSKKGGKRVKRAKKVLKRLTSSKGTK